MQAEVVDDIETTDSHPAMESLDELLRNNEIPLAKYKEMAAKFRRLNTAFKRSCETEQKLMRKARDMNKELKAQKLTIQNSASQEQEHRTQLVTIRQAATSVQLELESTQEQIAATTENTIIKRKEMEKLQEKVTRAKEEQITKLDPQKKQIQEENTALEESIHQRRLKIEAMGEESKALIEKIAKCDKQLKEIDEKKRSSNQRMLEISAFPIKIRQKSMTVEAALNTMIAEERTSLQQLEQTDGKIDTLYNKAHDFETEYQHITVDMDGINDATMRLARRYDQLRGQISEDTNMKLSKEYELRQLNKQIHEQNALVSNLDQKIDQIEKEIDKRTKECMKIEDTMAHMQVEKETMESQLRKMNEDVKNEKKFIESRNAELAKTQAGKENALKALLATESITAELMTKIKEELKSKDAKQMIIDRLTNKEHDLTQQLQEAVMIRNRKGREVAAIRIKIQDIRSMAVERNLHFLDLTRHLEICQEKLRESALLYEKVKTERNRYVNTIQTSQQLIVELNEKIKLLKNGVDVLRVEYSQVEAAVKLQKNELNDAWKRREATKGELKRAENNYRELQTKIDYQASETGRMSMVLQRIEDQINNQQNRYTIQADDCANIQRMLIDKQDELCMIYEQYNRHEEVMRRGEKALKDREEELKLLNLQLTDFVRKIDILQRKIPELRKYEMEIEELKLEIARERKDVDDLTKKLEVPDQKERKRHYCGKDISGAELDKKIAQYEARVKDKEHQKTESEILLRDIDDHIERIRGAATRDMTETSRKLEKGGNMRAQTMANRRKKMAALSEMAIYQAQTGDLQDQKKEVEREIEEAEVRTARGEAFDTKADKMIRMHERDIRTANAPRRRSVFDSDDEEEQRPGRQKFDAYPTADGLSRPYGAYPVFQPGQPSANLRFYKKEGQRPIVL